VRSSCQPSRTKIECESGFGIVSAMRAPFSTDAASLASSSLEKMPSPRNCSSETPRTGIATISRRPPICIGT
jgi:hypothetical protein